jgi:adenylate kinase
MTPQTFIFFGASGSGKGTQANLLIEYLKKVDAEKPIFYLETGEKFREFVTKEKSITRDLAKKIMDEGGLLPDFLPVWMWSQFLINNVTGNEHIVLDGLSRQEHEAPILDSAIKFYTREKPVVIVIEVSKEWSTDRLLGRGRSDDNVEDIKNRLEWYDNNVLPAIAYFKNDPYYTVISINGEQTIPEVHTEIMAKLNLK